MLRTTLAALALAGAASTAHAQGWYHVDAVSGTCAYSERLTPQAARTLIRAVGHSERTAVVRAKDFGAVTEAWVYDDTNGAVMLFFRDEFTCSFALVWLKNVGGLPPPTGLPPSPTELLN